MVGSVGEIPPGRFKLVTIDGREFGITNVNGAYRAVRNVCPHQGAPICRGTIGGTWLASAPGEFVWGRDGEILRCPWHGWEFDLQSGAALFDAGVRVRVLDVEIVQDKLFLTL
jgi:3-phenylpropionate/trans-cinnamate dioxygenase ferredoxin subunit